EIPGASWSVRPVPGREPSPGSAIIEHSWPLSSAGVALSGGAARERGASRAPGSAHGEPRRCAESRAESPTRNRDGIRWRDQDSSFVRLARKLDTKGSSLQELKRAPRRTEGSAGLAASQNSYRHHRLRRTARENTENS